MLDVVRQTCSAGENTTFSFRATSIRYCVKNFTNAPILVCLGHWNDNQSVRIDAGMYEIIQTNSEPEYGMARQATSKVIVKAEAAGEVEVQRYG